MDQVKAPSASEAEKSEITLAAQTALSGKPIDAFLDEVFDNVREIRSARRDEQSLEE